MTQPRVGETPSDADQREWRAKANNLHKRMQRTRRVARKAKGAPTFAGSPFTAQDFGL